MRSIDGMIEVLIVRRTILIGCGKLMAEIWDCASIFKLTALNSQRELVESKSAPR
jgi:peptidyl-tRNA hydrolase